MSCCGSFRLRHACALTRWTCSGGTGPGACTALALPLGRALVLPFLLSRDLLLAGPSEQVHLLCPGVGPILQLQCCILGYRGPTPPLHFFRGLLHTPLPALVAQFCLLREL